jgi:hypothetical protein
VKCVSCIARDAWPGSHKETSHFENKEKVAERSQLKKRCNSLIGMDLNALASQSEAKIEANCPVLRLWEATSVLLGMDFAIDAGLPVSLEGGDTARARSTKKVCIVRERLETAEWNADESDRVDCVCFTGMADFGGLTKSAAHPWKKLQSPRSASMTWWVPGRSVGGGEKRRDSCGVRGIWWPFSG